MDIISKGNPNTVTDSIFAIILLVGVLVGIWRKRSASAIQDGPILAGQGLLGGSDLTSMNRSVIAGFDYNMLTDDSGRVMFVVQLGHNSWAHIVAYGNASNLNGMTKGLLQSKWLEPVSLEGDFPDYFHMYCNPEAQSTIREVFAPDVMAQFADFCRAYDFELFHDTLYMSLSPGAHDTHDTTTLATDITAFLQSNANVLHRL